jgi:hypothetical protein
VSEVIFRVRSGDDDDEGNGDVEECIGEEVKDIKTEWKKLQNKIILFRWRQFVKR